MSLLNNVVAILNAQGQIVGTGFVVSPRWVVTCAHVARAAGAGAPSAGARVCVQLHAGKQRFWGDVLPGHWSAEDEDDLAVLAFTRDLDPAQPVRLAEGAARGTFRAFGYRDFSSLDGMWAQGEVVGVTKTQTGHARLQLRSLEAWHGMSGAPVQDPTTGAVIGYIKSGQNQAQGDKITLAIPTETMFKHCPQLEQPLFAVPNPFFAAGRINDPAQFFGRERVVQDLRTTLRQRQNCALIGASQLGKSSLLYYLYRTQAQWLTDSTVQVVYVDLQGALDEADFCTLTLQALQLPGDSLRALRDALTTRPAILLLDEIERLATSDFSPRLRDVLRALAQNDHLAFCLAAQRPLNEVFPIAHDPVAPSPFYNVFPLKLLMPFTETEARAFIAHRLAPTGLVFSESDLLSLLLHSATPGGYHPARLQQAAWELFEQKK